MPLVPCCSLIKVSFCFFLSILAEENLANSYNLMEIEQRLNEAGRGEPLLPNETARQASLHVLDDLLQSDDGDYADHFLLSCFTS
jgi:hypothetical protein